jgi:uncharacterized protein (UPF0332 family)
MQNRFDGNGFVKIASEILSCTQADPESAARTAAGRFYYGAFLQARDAANIKNTSGSVHDSVIQAYAAKNSKLSNQLNELRKLRNAADYQINAPFPPINARRCQTLAKKILADLPSQK